MKDFGAVFDAKRQEFLDAEAQKRNSEAQKRETAKQRRTELMVSIDTHVRPVLDSAKLQLEPKGIRVNLDEDRSEPELKFSLQLGHGRPSDTYFFRAFPKRINCTALAYGTADNHGSMAAQIELEVDDADAIRQKVEGVVERAIRQIASPA